MNYHKDETLGTGRGTEGFKTASLTRVVKWSRFTSSKQLQPAMTFQVYTKSIKSRNPIENINALVRVQSHFESGVNRIYGDTGRILYSCNAGKVGAPKLRQRNLPPDGSRQAALVKMFLIQIEPRLECDGITGRSPPLLIDNYV